jgi:biopolymer transport protein ExbB
MSALFWEAWEYLEQGGWVMIPLGAVSLLMWIFVFDCLVRFAGYTRDDIDGRGAIAALAAGKRSLPGAGIRRALLNQLLGERSGDADLDRNILHQHLLALRPQIRRHLAMIAVLAAVAPLLGLLGTVLGMIETFDVIALFGTGNAKAMAGGISVALITTQTGLLVAIPGLFLSGVLSRKARHLGVRLDEVTMILGRVVLHCEPAQAAEECREAIAARDMQTAY